ncbi:MAG: GntR family transcriptional regulator [Clostridiales bacterium]|nr:GntR family transcriptional regulator [Clostridiales bacterium]
MNEEHYGSLREQVFTKIEEDIINGRYKAGEKITENMLSNDLGVSRTPIREAIRQLELEGLVETIPNKGIVVTGVTKEDIEDIYEIRELIEGLAARKSALKMGEDELERLQEIIDLQEFYTMRDDIKGLVRMDSEFHKLIFKGSNSKTLKNILSMFHHNLKKARHDSFSKEFKQEILEEHKLIYKAISDKDSKLAEKLTNLHVKNAKKRLLRKEG